jgi:hypothetical protein
LSSDAIWLSFNLQRVVFAAGRSTQRWRSAEEA